MENKTEVFKVSKKSICHECKYLDRKCSLRVQMVCGTDRKVALAFVKNCSDYERSVDSVGGKIDRG